MLLRTATVAAVVLALVSTSQAWKKEEHQVAFRGALVRKALNNGAVVNQSIPNAQYPYAQLTFNEAVYDTDSFWDASQNCFVIPVGVSKVSLQIQAVFATNANGMRQILVQRKRSGETDWSFFMPQPIQNGRAISETTTDLSANSAAFDVQEGDRFAFMVQQFSGDALNVSGGTGTFFALRVVE